MTTPCRCVAVRGSRCSSPFGNVAQPRQIHCVGDLAQEAIQLLALQSLRPTRFQQHRIGLRLRRQVRHRVGVEHAKRQRHDHQRHRRQPFELLFDARFMQQLAQPQVLPELAHKIATGLGLCLRLAGCPSGLDWRPTLTCSSSSRPFSLAMAFGGLALGLMRDRTGFMLWHGAVSPLELKCGDSSLADSAILVKSRS